MRKLMTLDDLYAFYASTGTSFKFSAEDEDAEILVSVNGDLSCYENDDDNVKEDLTMVKLKACHTLANANMTYISKDTMESALESFANRPILAYIHERDDGEKDFWRHNRHEDEDGNIVYDEKPVGHIPADCDVHLEYDEDAERDYVVVKGYLYDEYSDAVKILKREGKCSVSVELKVKKFSYDAEKKILVIEDFIFSGVTILGHDPEGNEIKPGMEGSNIVIDEYAVGSESTPIIQERGKTDMAKFEELLEQYGKTVEDIDFEYEGMSDEELEIKFAEVFGADDGSDDEGGEPAPDINEQSDDDDSGSEDDGEETYQKVFDISHDDIRYGLYQLLASVESADDQYYWIEAVYDEYFVYCSYRGDVIYGQGYTVEDDVISFSGERYTLHRELLTDSEYAKLKEMRENYDAIADKLAKYEDEPKKLEILTSDAYAQVADTDQFKALLEQSGHFDLTIQEVSDKADELLLAYAKGTKLEFSAKEDDGMKVTSKRLPINQKKISRYGSIFSK